MQACHEKFDLVTSVMPAGHGVKENGSSCSPDDIACYYTEKAARMLSWVIHLGGGSEKTK